MAKTKEELIKENRILKENLETTKNITDNLSREHERLNEILSLYLGVHHDLRNKLVKIGGFARNLYKKEEDPITQQFLQIISGDVTDSENLLRDIKKIHDIQAGVETLSKSYETNLYTIIEEIITKYQGVIGDDFHFENNLGKSKDSINFNVGVHDGLVRSVYDNLVGNTIKFNQKATIPKPIKISFGANDLGDFIKCHYWDNGMGVAQEKIEKIFDLFVRGDHSIPGSGIGLYFVKMIIEKHGGEINIESDTDLSKEEGHYVHFIFTLPKPQSYSD